MIRFSLRSGYRRSARADGQTKVFAARWKRRWSRIFIDDDSTRSDLESENGLSCFRIGRSEFDHVVNDEANVSSPFSLNPSPNRLDKLFKWLTSNFFAPTELMIRVLHVISIIKKFSISKKWPVKNWIGLPRKNVKKK